MDKIIYHYCSNQSFYSILDTNTLWLSNAQHSNDALETKMFLVALENSKPTITLDSGRSISRDLLIDAYKLSNREIYYCCFSDLPDDLSQWRGYGANSCGYAIGFSERKLKRILKDRVSEIPAASFDLAPVNYCTPEEAINNLQQHLTESEDFKRQHVMNSVTAIHVNDRLVAGGDSKASPDETLAFIAATKLCKSAALYKNADFSAEEESRAYIITSYEKLRNTAMPLRFSNRGNKIVSYLEIAGANSAIQKVVIGKNCSDVDSEIERFVKTRDGIEPDCKVQRSAIGYRV